MDRNSIIAMVLIAIVIILLPYYQKLINGNQPPKKENVQQVENKEPEKEKPEIQTTDESPTSQTKEIESDIDTVKTVKKLNVPVIQDSTEELTEINTDKIHVIISNKGGGNLIQFVLLDYDEYDSTKVNMIDTSINNGLTLTFQNNNGDFIDLDNYLFKERKTGNPNIEPGRQFKIKYTITIDGNELTKTYIFYDDKYHFDLVVNFSNPGNMLLNRKYQIGWKNGLPSTEAYTADDYNYSQTYVYMAESLESYSISEPGKKETEVLSGSADWLAVRTKYFISSLIHVNADVSEGVYISGIGVKKPDYVQRLYDFGYNTQYSGSNDTLRVYIGPLDHSELSYYDNNLDELIMNNGWYERTFRFISLLILPVLEFLYKIIPNYGIVIIIFSILIKIIVHPLTKKSYSSMKEMQKIQPLMAEIKEKYKDDSQRMNKEMMNLYKQHGVNPMGGCLPMLLQMPLLIALFIVFRSTIELRGAMFIPGWITDLSRPDTLFTLPFSLPMYGNEFNLLPILMSLTMIFQSKMTMQDPKQKAMVYIMPVFMLLIFNRFPSGLNLYYTMFNLLTIIQQKFIGNSSDKNPKPDTEKKKKQYK